MLREHRILSLRVRERASRLGKLRVELPVFTPNAHEVRRVADRKTAAAARAPLLPPLRVKPRELRRQRGDLDGEVAPRR